MKHPQSLILLLLLFGLQASEVQAQALRFDGGPIAGLNATQVQGDDYTGFNKIGLS